MPTPSGRPARWKSGFSAWTTSGLESRDLIMQLTKQHKYTLCLEPGIPGDAVMNWRKGIGRLTMGVSGRNAHAGIEPEKGRNATVELAHQILQFSNLSDAKNDKTDALVAYLQKIYTVELGPKLGIEGSGGGSDANYAAIVGSIAVDGLGFVGGGDHTPDEYIELKSIESRLYLLTRIIMDIGSGKI